MVFVTGYGQMCNNILQFGHYYAWGKEHGVETIGIRFCYKYPFFKINNEKGYNWFTYLFAKYAAKTGLIRKVSFNDEESFNQSNLDLLISSKFVLAKGWYLKDYEAFLRHRKEIKELFAFEKEIVGKMDTLLPLKSKASLRLGVHIRRGDYIRWNDGKYFFTDAEYILLIQSFMKSIGKKDVEIILVTNDQTVQPEAYKEVLKISVLRMNGNSGEDLYALSTCDYIIGPPSTFSLVASFYNDTPLYWIFDKNKEILPDSFRRFDYLFRHII